MAVGQGTLFLWGLCLHNRRGLPGMDSDFVPRDWIGRCRDNGKLDLDFLVGFDRKSSGPDRRIACSPNLGCSFVERGMEQIEDQRVVCSWHSPVGGNCGLSYREGSTHIRLLGQFVILFFRFTDYKVGNTSNNKWNRKEGREEINPFVQMEGKLARS